MRFLVLIFSLHIFLQVSGQTGNHSSQSSDPFRFDFTPTLIVSPSKAEMLEYRRRFLLWSGRFAGSQEAKYTFAKFSQQKSEFIQSLDSLKLLMSTDSVTIFLNRIKDEIVRHNPPLQPEYFNVFIYRTVEPNAFNLGEGIILVSTGLLTQMNSVHQLAFILAHEMSHEIESHVFNYAAEYVTDLHDVDLKRQVRQALRSPLSSRSRVENLIENFMTTHVQYRQQHELLADSMGFILARNAGFDMEEFPWAIELISKLEPHGHSQNFSLESFLRDHAIDVHPMWMNHFTYESRWAADSTLYETPEHLKTHPEWEDRVEKIDSLIQQCTISDLELPSWIQDWTYSQKRLLFEMLVGQVSSDDLADGLFGALHLSLDYPENIFLKCLIVHCFLELGDRLSAGDFLKIVDFPHPKYPEGYNQFLGFLHNLNAADFRSIADALIKQIIPPKNDHPYYEFIKFIQDKSNREDPEARRSFISRYEGQFPAEVLKRKTAN